MDQSTIDRIQLLHPALRQEALDIYTNQIIPALTSNTFCRFAFTLRTFAQQDVLYAQGRTKLYDASGHKLGIVTNAKAGQSLHNYGLALDIVLINASSASWDTVKDFDGDGKSDWMEVINIFKANGWEWGGDWKSFKDLPHVQKTFGHDWSDLLFSYNNGNTFTDSNNTYVNL